MPTIFQLTLKDNWRREAYSLTLIDKKWQIKNPALAANTISNYPPSHISITELKSLLVSLADRGPRTNFRYRLMGEMWQSVFMRVLFVTDTGVMLKDEIHDRAVLISDVGMIIQFELDGSIYHYAPNFHYDVTPSQLYGKGS